MKRIYLRLVAALLTFLISLGVYYFVVHHRSPAVLEIYTKGSGMVYPKDEVLDFRLYEDGRFEYDYYPDQDPPRVTMTNVVITRKEAKLSPEDARELISLAEQPDFLSAKETYPGLRPHIDDSWKTTIKFMRQGREKQIIAINFWDMLFHPEDKDKYPPSMVKLLERVRELKKKAVGKDL